MFDLYTVTYHEHRLIDTMQGKVHSELVDEYVQQQSLYLTITALTLYDIPYSWKVWQVESMMNLTNRL